MANQEEYLKSSGREGFEVPTQWKGLEYTRQSIDKLRKDLLDPYRDGSPFNKTFEKAKEMGSEMNASKSEQTFRCGCNKNCCL